MSFNTTSLKGRSDTELAENIVESSKLDGSEAESKKRKSDSGVSSSERSGPSPPGFAQHSFDNWSISSNIDNTVQVCLDIFVTDKNQSKDNGKRNKNMFCTQIGYFAS